VTAAPGSTIGPYTIDRELGRGGMGVVYLARDTRLDRAVAIKALPEHLAQDPERLSRFEREAKTLATLNHPNIAGIFGLEEHAGSRYLVLEYVEGETLADILDRGPVPVDDAIELATQIAAGVEAAHEAGVIHRDLKPGNIIITPDGQAKVLDFGLARIEESTSSSSGGTSQSPTATSPAIQHSPTMPGVILGTAAYMSPEQARGRKVDKRTDIWSFGVVLYEMLTGASPFAGETVSDSIGAVLHKEVDLDRLPPTTPDNVRRALRRCLERDKAKRYRDIGDAALDLRAADMPAGVAPAPTSRTRRIALLATVFLLGAAVVAGAMWRLAPSPELRVRRFEIAVESTPGEVLESPVISPNGQMVVYRHRGRLWIRDLSAFESRELPDTQSGIEPFWSPDSQWVGFAQGRLLMKAPVSGGPAQQIATMSSGFVAEAGAAWLEDGTIVYTTGNSPLMAVSSLGGTPTVWLETAPGEDDFHDASALPNGRGVLFTVHLVSGGLFLAASDGTRRTIVLPPEDTRPNLPRYAEPGYVLFNRGGANAGVWAIPFSLESLETTGEPFLVAGLAQDASASSDGTMALLNNAGGQSVELAWIPLDGSTQEAIGEPLGVIAYPQLSPDGARIAYRGGSHTDVGIWVHDLETGSRSRITFGETDLRQPEWSPDGEVIALTREQSDPPSILFFASDGSGQVREPIVGSWASFDPDWTAAVVERPSDGSGRSDVWTAPLDEPEEARPLIATPADEDWVRLSPDGAWLLYTSDETGSYEVFMTRFPSGRGRWQISDGGGVRPEWGPDSDRIYYVALDTWLMEVTLETQPTVLVSAPRPVFPVSGTGWLWFRGYDVPPPGDRILGVRNSVSDAGETSIGVIENWRVEFDE